MVISYDDLMREIPENQNIIIPSSKSIYTEVKTENGWEKKETDEALNRSFKNSAKKLYDTKETIESVNNKVFESESNKKIFNEVKQFAKSGLKILCKYAPSAFVVPITINNSWKFFKFGFLPFGLGIRIVFTIHEAISVKNSNSDELTNITEDLITKNIIT